MSPTRSVVAAVAALLLTFGAGYVGSRFPIDEWYAALAKPSWNPPNWLFGPVWGILYLLIAAAAWLIWRRNEPVAALPSGLFLIQLILNAAWSWIFFGRHEIGLALLEILILWFAILATAIAFWRLNPVSGYLMLPYLGWVAFAAALNYAIWRLNT